MPPGALIDFLLSESAAALDDEKLENQLVALVRTVRKAARRGRP
jgi:hypothetical protein